MATLRITATKDGKPFDWRAYLRAEALKTQEAWIPLVYRWALDKSPIAPVERLIEHIERWYDWSEGGFPYEDVYDLMLQLGLPEEIIAAAIKAEVSYRTYHEARRYNGERINGAPVWHCPHDQSIKELAERFKDVLPTVDKINIGTGESYLGEPEADPKPLTEPPAKPEPPEWWKKAFNHLMNN